MGFDHLFEDRDSFASQLIRQKARQLVRHPGFNKSEQKDVEQDLAMELVLKYRCFDPDRARETTFIARVVENKAISLVRVRSVERAQTFDASSATNHTGQSRRTDEEQSQLRLDIAEVLDFLPEDLRHLAELLQKMTEYAASRNLGTSRRQVSKDMRRLRERFEDANLRDYL